MAGWRAQNVLGWCAFVLIWTTACGPATNTDAVTDFWPADDAPAAEALTPGCDGREALLGIDVSEFQETIDWSALAESEIRFAFIRVADGVLFKDLTFEENWRAAKAAGIPRGAYHFFDPTEDALEQAQLFVESVGPLEAGDLPPVLDFETLRGVSPARAIREADRWVGHVRWALGVDPIVYTGPSFWEDVLGAPETFASYEPWISHFTGGCPWVPEPWTATRFHQFTERGWIQGIETYVDLNWFYGTEAELRALQVPAPQSQQSDGTCDEESAPLAQSGQPCAAGCVYSTWAVAQGYQDGEYDCGSQPCACVVQGQVRERCEVEDIPQGGARGSECAASCVWSSWSVRAGIQPQSHLCGEEPCACVVQGNAAVSCLPDTCQEQSQRADALAAIWRAKERGLLGLWDHTFWRSDGSARIDGADASRNIELSLAGRGALRSCYQDAPCGRIQLEEDMLVALRALHEEFGFQFFVTSIAGGSHGVTSAHYAGRAFDVDEINGVRIDGPSEQTDAFMDACLSLGATEVRGPAIGSDAHRFHIECAF